MGNYIKRYESKRVEMWEQPAIPYLISFDEDNSVRVIAPTRLFSGFYFETDSEMYPADMLFNFVKPIEFNRNEDWMKLGVSYYYYNVEQDAWVSCFSNGYLPERTWDGHEWEQDSTVEQVNAINLKNISFANPIYQERFNNFISENWWDLEDGETVEYESNDGEVIKLTALLEGEPVVPGGEILCLRPGYTQSIYQDDCGTVLAIIGDIGGSNEDHVSYYYFDPVENMWISSYSNGDGDDAPSVWNSIDPDYDFMYGINIKNVEYDTPEAQQEYDEFVDDVREVQPFEWNISAEEGFRVTIEEEPQFDYLHQLD